MKYEYLIHLGVVVALAFASIVYGAKPVQKSKADNYAVRDAQANKMRPAQ